MRLSLLIASILATATATTVHAEPTRDLDLGATVGVDGIMRHGAIALGGSEQLSDIVSGLPEMLRAHIQLELGKAIGADVSDGGFQSKRVGLELRPCLSAQLCIIAGADFGYIVEDVTRNPTASTRTDTGSYGSSNLDADIGLVAIARLGVDLGLDTHWRVRVGIEHTIGLQSLDQLDSNGGGKNPLDGWSGSGMLSFRF